MELFALHCTTCKARLRVTDESVIGQILSCPKCHSMVMVEPPPGWGSGVTDRLTAVPLEKTAPPSVLKPPPLPVPPALPRATAPVLAATAELPPPLPQTGPAPRNVWLFTGGVAAGAAIGVTLWMLIAPQDPSTAPVATTANIAAIEMPETASPPTLEEPKSIDVQSLKPVIEESPQADVAKPPLGPVFDPEAQIRRELGVEQQAVEQPVVEKVDVSPDLVFEPVAPASSESQSLPISDPQTPETTLAAPAGTAPQVDEPSSRFRGRLLKGVDFKNVPLRQFVAFVAEYSGVKITIDAESLKSAGIKSPTITVRKTDMAIDKLLQSVLDEQGLSFEIRNDAIVIFAPR
jgi:hypothetical protein